MAIPKLFLTLDTLDQNEWSSCKKYMKMHFGEGTDNHVCLMALYRNRSTLSDEDLVLDIRQQFFPNMSQKSFFNMLSRLMGYVDDWIAYYTFQQERYLNDLYKIKAYSRKGLYKIANQKAKLLEDEIFSVEGLNLDKSKALGDLYRVQYYSDNPIKHERLDLFRLMVEQKTIKLCNDLMLYHAEMSNWGRIKKLDFEDLKTMTMAVAEVAPASEELKTLKTHSSNS